MKQVADRLQLSERTVYRLLQRGDLPGRKVGGQWRFRMAEVDYWLDLRLTRLGSDDLRRLDRPAAGRQLWLSEAMRPENALIPLAPGGPREVVAAFAAAVSYAEAVDRRALADRIWEREELSSTATADGVAFLHTARWQSRVLVASPLVAFGRLARPLDFGALDGTPTDLLFLILAPNAQLHLALLARAAHLCRDARLLAGLRAARSGREVIDLIRASERAAFRPRTDR